MSQFRILILLVAALAYTTSCTLSARKCEESLDCFVGETCTDGRCVERSSTEDAGSDAIADASFDAAVDVFVPETCGNTALDQGEKCDDSSPIPCPTDCDDGVVCTEDSLTGSAEACSARCVHRPINECVDDDGCCASGCTANTDDDCDAICGNGRVEPGETCDGNCPVCSDVDACTTTTTVGSPGTCDVECQIEIIEGCVDGDDCCPSGCDSSSDDDCSATCGNGIVDDMETCDGNCPVATDCDDGKACTVDELRGSAANCTARCNYSTITACTDGDDCCPVGCDSTNDTDCEIECGNGIVEQGEVCDGNCPSTCEDGDQCTMDSLSGSAATCDASCEHTPITACTDGDGCCPSGCDTTNDTDCSAECGNDIVEAGESCDGDCPTSCDDGDPCTADSMSGSAATCDVTCTQTQITSCNMTSDGCCPTGCTTSNDADCEAPGCVLGDSSNCSCDNLDELCIGGECEMETSPMPDDCDEACEPAQFCENNSLGNACNGGSCVCDCGQCDGGTEGCDPSGQGPCVDVTSNLGGDCSLACDPDAYCEQRWAPEAQCLVETGTCIVPCDALICDCDPGDVCYDGMCTAPPLQDGRGCSFACEPDTYCEQAYGSGFSCESGGDAEDDDCTES